MINGTTIIQAVVTTITNFDQACILWSSTDFHHGFEAQTAIFTSDNCRIPRELYSILYASLEF